MKGIWCGISLDRAEEKVRILTFAKSQEVCWRRAYRRDKENQVKVFNLADHDLGGQLFDWFRSRGVVTSDAHELVRAFGRELLRITK